jgi:hypothetical protein
LGNSLTYGSGAGRLRILFGSWAGYLCPCARLQVGGVDLSKTTQFSPVILTDLFIYLLFHYFLIARYLQLDGVLMNFSSQAGPGSFDTVELFA